MDNKFAKNLEIYCMCLYDHYLENLKILNYKPVGLGDGIFRKEWLKDSEGDNISYKNKNYGEYTFYYWFWKNKLKDIADNKWIGFSHYRHHWSNQSKIKSDELNKIIDVNKKENFLNFMNNLIEKNNDIIAKIEDERIYNEKLVNYTLNSDNEYSDNDYSDNQYSDNEYSNDTLNND